MIPTILSPAMSKEYDNLSMATGLGEGKTRKSKQRPSLLSQTTLRALSNRSEGVSSLSYG